MTPTPTAPPIVRLNWTRPVATARRLQATELWTETSTFVVMKPIPSPVIAAPTMTSSRPSKPPIWVRIAVPTTSASAPATTTRRAPNRMSARPPTTDPIGQPIDIAATATPASTGLPPWTPWIIGGTYVVTPNMMTPPSTEIARPAPMSGTRTSSRSTSGSGARRSVRTNSASRTAAAASRPITIGDVQPSDGPPSETATRRATIPSVSSTPPCQSSWCGCRSNRSWKTRQMMKPATIPTGMLISNTQGQPTVVVRTPPRAGPTIAATPQTPLKRPCIFAR
ncbi:MAG TPA: hypothetical protein VFS32_11095 [Candidatus Limnocylindrales bacterium]|nr:hypothetical protein [Candidatus Limnocylindrales bacterium]